jgi:tRNA(fMet)-specific endonuclease VapC
MFLDTVAYSALAEGMQSIIDAISSASAITLPLPVIGELRYGFLKGSQTERNEENLQRFLAQAHVSIAEPTIKTTTLYAQLQLLCVRRGKVLSHNDIWIAALALEAEATLVTYDQDFSVFSELFDNKLIILT